MGVYLLRHGATEWSDTGRHTGRTDVPLTEVGRDRAKGVRLPRDLPVVSSPRSRALDTAELAGLTVTEVTEDLAEWDYGDYEGLTTPQIRERVPGWTVWTHPCPNGETAEQVTERARRVLARADDVILVGHGHFSRVLAAVWIGQTAEFGVHFRHDPATFTVLDHERESPQIARVGATS
ncbi:histidine phosphatase family protein [Actinokineospora globicatena]|uniref:histidine phosphatase family protein n=1 Tax=Actinokineospora globicatena TaxID=103729 RepID=UPI0020A2F271|nr:histidine phosphatase family protein [Actinokineospora globicatena]MCP2302148.1 putative phosphoglycerate mutase [Actinokineospora globicatena]GLW76191.1 phosphoglycerate mutase [Actinokineospora globicatena]GLW83027.1 phosphoglycerate mutase [Actinokineospora globicatena]